VEGAYPQSHQTRWQRTLPCDARGQQRFTLAGLDRIRKETPYLYNCQYLNDPTPTETAFFSEPLLLAHTIPEIQVPLHRKTLDGSVVRMGRVVIAWDLAYSEKKHADYTAGVAGLYDPFGKLYIIDMEFGRFNPYELVQKDSHHGLQVEKVA